MNHRRAGSILALSLASGLAGCAPTNKAFDAVRLVMESEVGRSAHPAVSFLRDSTHLLVQLDSATLASLPDSAFAARARQLASLALSSYPRAPQLDSITIGTVASMGQQVPFTAVRVVRERTFAVAELRGGATPDSSTVRP